MDQAQSAIVQSVRQALLSLLSGKRTDTLAEYSHTTDRELQELCETANLLIGQFNEARGFLASFARGTLESDPPCGNLLISPFKQLHANMRHLVWQTKQVAKGDLSQQVDFLGGFSDAFNSMIASLRNRREIELALKRSEERLALAIDGGELGLWDYNVGSGEVVFNKRWAEMLEYDPEEVEPSVRFWHELVHPEDKANFLSAWESHLKHDTPMFKVERRLRTKSGDWKWIFCLGRIVETDAQGKPTRVAGISVDITDRKRAEELAVQTARLRAVADLSAGVAHHFNNLLQIIIGSISLCCLELEYGDTTYADRTLRDMLEAAKHGAETVRRLQTFANMEADATKAGTIFDLTDTVGNAIEVSKPLWKAEPEKNGLTIDLQSDLKAGCLVKGKENEIFEVTVNLLKNAAEAMPEGGNIRVESLVEGHEVVIRVRDTGTGIADEDLKRVFEPFWSTKGVEIGKGLGLAVTHGLVKRHGGAISVQSKIGEGTTFTIRLPLADEPVLKAEQPELSTEPGSLRILVIEDELHIATILERMLARAGYRIFKALSGQEGLEIFNKEHVDLVFCDLGMPGMNGWEVGKAIRTASQQKGIPKPTFIILTGWGGQELETEKVAESGTDAVLSKPIDSNALLASVRKVAARCRSWSPVLGDGST